MTDGSGRRGRATGLTGRRSEREGLDRLIEAYRKLRNTFRYALGNIHDFNPATDAISGGDLQEIDQWILARTDEVIEALRAAKDGAP